MKYAQSNNTQDASSPLARAFYAKGREEWLTSDRWPLREVTPRTLHLTTEGSLAGTPPATAGSLPLGSDPAAGTADGQAFLTPPLDEDLQLMGPVTVTLTVEAAARDLDLLAVPYRPDAPRTVEKSLNLLGAWRARYRSGPGAPPAPLEPGQPVTATLTFGPLGHRIAKGERLGLWVAAAMPGTMLLNSQTGAAIAGETAFVPATHRLLIGPGRAARVQLSVLR